VEGRDEERRYKAVKEEMNDEGRRKWWEEKLDAIQEENGWFLQVFCSREEGLVCLDRKCVECEDEGVRGNSDLRKACHQEKVGGGSSGARRNPTKQCLAY
jgi:hypothetical protein